MLRHFLLPRASWPVAVLVAVAAIGNVLAADRPSTTRCVAADTNPRIEWIVPRESPKEARVYFRSENAKGEHYVPMRRRAGSPFVAILPKIAAGTTAIDYRVAAPDGKGEYATRLTGRLNVDKACPATALSPAEAKITTALVVGATVDGPAIPVGFRCDGIIGRINAAGALSAYDACRSMAELSNTVAAVQQNAGVATATKGAAAGAKPSLTEGSLGVGVITPEHHRRPRRAPVPPQPPNPRLTEPVSPSRP